MVAPRFGDSFEAISTAELHARDSQNAAERAAFNNQMAPVIVNQTNRFGNANYFKLDEQAKSFRYWRFIAINKIADRCSQEFPHVGHKKRIGKGEQSRLPRETRQFLRQQYGLLQHIDEDIEPAAESHPLVQLFSVVNPSDTWGEFLAETVMYLRLMHVFTWWLIPNAFRTERAPGGLPSQIMALPPQWITPLYHEDRTFKSWEVLPYADESMRFELPFEQIVVGKKKNPRSKAIMDTYSPYEAAPAWVENVESIEMSRRSGFANGVNPDVLLHLDGEVYKDPDPDILTRIKERFMARTGRMDRRSGEPMIVPPGIEAEKWSHTNKEMDFTVSASQVRDNNLALDGCPPVIAGVTSDYTRATADAATVVFCEHTINPTLAFIAGVLTEKVASLYDPRLLVWFGDCVPSNAEFELLQDEADFKMGALDPDEIRQKRGRDPKAESAYETGYLPHSFSPLNEDLQPEPLDLEAGDKGDDFEGEGDDEDQDENEEDDGGDEE